MHMELLLTIMSRPHVYQGRCQLPVPGTMRAAGSGPPHNGNRGAKCKTQKKNRASDLLPRVHDTSRGVAAMTPGTLWQKGKVPNTVHYGTTA